MFVVSFSTAMSCVLHTRVATCLPVPVYFAGALRAFAVL